VAATVSEIAPADGAVLDVPIGMLDRLLDERYSAALLEAPSSGNRAQRAARRKEPVICDGLRLGRKCCLSKFAVA
jgi:hypothetical protein